MSEHSTKSLSVLVKELIDDKDIDTNTDNLVELKTILCSADNKQLEEVLKSINFSQFCTDLNEFEDTPNFNLIVSIFEVIFGSLSPQFALNSFPKEIVNGLNAKNEIIVDLWLKTLDKCLAEELSLNHALSSDLDIHRILLKVCQMLSQPKTLTAKYCHSIALNIAKSNVCGEKFFEKDIQNVLIETKKVNDITRLRVYELLVSVANTSHKNFVKIESFGHLNHLLDDFTKDSADDPLVTLNILEVMASLGTTSFGTNYLLTSDILKTVSERLRDSETDIFGSLLIPGYIKLFGTLGSNEPKIVDKYPSVLSKLKQLLMDLNTNLRLSSIDAIAVMATKNDGKVMLNKHSELPKVYMATISELFRSGSNELKTRALTALSVLLKVEEPDPKNIGSSFAETWFRLLLNDQRLTLLLKACKEPFLDIKLSALECIRVLASQLWGQKELATTPGFLEYILNRNSETTKEAKEAKYAVVRELVRSQFINTTFTKEAVVQLKAHDKEGPYYVANETAVSFEAN